MSSKPKSRKVAVLLALSGVVFPIVGFHKFYLGQPLWGLLYVLLSWTPIPHVAGVLEGIWYLVREEREFNRNFNRGVVVATSQVLNPFNGVYPTDGRAISRHVEDIANAVRQLERLRREGLISEYEFEQKRRQLLDRIQ